MIWLQVITDYWYVGDGQIPWINPLKWQRYIYFHQVTFSNPRWLLEVLFYIYPCLCFSNRWFCLSCTVPSNWYFISHRCCFVYPDCVLVMFHLIDISYLTGVVLFTGLCFSNVPSNWYFISHRCCFVYPDCVLVMFPLIDVSCFTGVVLSTRIVF